MKKAISIILLCIVPAYLFSTCIVVAKTKNSILVAADSRSNFYNVFDPNSAKTALSICKIHNVNDIYFAVAGHGDNLLAQECFNSLKETKDINKAINNLGKSMMQQYSDMMSKEKEKNQPNYNYYLKNALAGISFFEVKKNIPILYYIEFSMKNDGSIRYNITQPPIVFMGIHDHIEALPGDKIKEMLFNKAGFIYGLESFVKLEIKNHPNDIAYPIDLLELKQGEVNWIRRKKECN
jgi:hypothetical protein